MALLDDLKWRHAVKAYDPNKKLDKAVVEQIVEAARLAPTSSGYSSSVLSLSATKSLKRRW